MKVLITGSSGFVGKHVADLFDDKICITRKKPMKQSGEEFYIDNINGGTVWGPILKNVDCIVHLAAVAHNKSLPSKQYTEVNFEGTVKLATDAAKRGVKRFIFLSTIGVFGNNSTDKPLTCDAPANPHDDYSVSKYKAEKALRAIEENYGMQCVILRAPLIYGSGAPGSLGLLTKFVYHFPISPFGNVKNRRSLISVHNLAQLIKACANSKTVPSQVILPFDITLSTKKLMTLIAEGVNKNLLHLPIPLSALKLICSLFGKLSMLQPLISDLEIDENCDVGNIDWKPTYLPEYSLTKYSRKQ